jgi:hypothetical protein
LGANEFYRKVWDPVNVLNRAELPTLWFSWPNDKHFPLDSLATSYKAMSGPFMVSLLPGMKHSTRAAWTPPDSYAFAKSVVVDGRMWAQQTGSETKGNRFTASFKTTKPFDESVLISTVDTGFTGLRKWKQTPAKLESLNDEWVATATLPESTTAWFINLKSEKLTVSSEFMER